MLLLLVGWAAGGLVHLLLLAALVSFPWRDGAADDGAADDGPPAQASPSPSSPSPDPSESDDGDDVSENGSVACSDRTLK